MRTYIIHCSPIEVNRSHFGDSPSFTHEFHVPNCQFIQFHLCVHYSVQNWDHVLHVMDHLHLQPKQTHGTDFARVRSWAVNGWTKYYRQTLVFSAFLLPPIVALYSNKCANYEGKVQVLNPKLTGTISRIVVKLPQVTITTRDNLIPLVIAVKSSTYLGLV